MAAMTPAGTMRAAVEALTARLRTPRVTHHQVSQDWDDYATVARTHSVETIKLEAADMLDSLLRSALEQGEPEEQARALHQQVMNLPCKPYDGTDAYTHYCRGHRDARHAAAELVLASIPPNTPVEDGKLGFAQAPSDDEIRKVWNRTQDLIATVRAFLPSGVAACKACGGTSEVRHIEHTPAGRPITCVDPCPACGVPELVPIPALQERYEFVLAACREAQALASRYAWALNKVATQDCCAEQALDVRGTFNEQGKSHG